MSENNTKYVVSDEYLEHFNLGEEAKKHLYTARNWVNGRWQYIYGKANKAKTAINNALGADEMRNRDTARDIARSAAENANNYKNAAKSDYDKYSTAIGNSMKTRRKPGQATGSASNDVDYWKKRAVDSAKESERVSGIADRTNQRYKDAQDAYDRTFYGKIEKGKNAIKKILGRLRKKSKRK